MKSRKESGIRQKLIHAFLRHYTILFVFFAVIALTIASTVIIQSFAGTLSAGTRLVSDLQTSYEQTVYHQSSFFNVNYELAKRVEAWTKSPTEQNKAKIDLYLNSYQAHDGNMLFLYLENASGETFSSLNYNRYHFPDFLQQDAVYRSLIGKNIHYLSPVMASDSERPEFLYYLSPISLNGEVFWITAVYDAAPLTESLKNAAGQMDAFDLYSSSGDFLYQYGSGLLTLPDISNGTEGFFIDAGGIHYYVRSSFNSCYVVGTIHYLRVVSRFLLILLVLLMTTLLPLFFSVRHMTAALDTMVAPITVLAEQAGAFSLGADPIEPLRTGDELEKLSVKFSEMTANINAQAVSLAEEEREKAETYYKLLTTQLDPHFIYNTMNIINILARQQAYDDIIRVNTSLTKVLRERLNTQDHSFERVGDEIDTLMNYLTIMNYRYHGCVQVDCDMDPSVKNYRIPKNILQPMIENSYYHGLSGENGSYSGQIDICLYQMEGFLIIEISDNGNGMTKERLNQVMSTLRDYSDTRQHPEDDSHIGLSNIYRRLHYLYEDRFSMDIKSEEGCGTTIVVSLPLQ